MNSPAQQAGFIVNVTRLKINNPEHGRYSQGLVWLLREDDETNLPFFKSECGTVSNECFFVADLSIIPNEVPAVPVSPKFPVGSSVKVVDSGWGFGPEMIGTVLTVVNFTLRGTEETTYHVVDSEGQRRGGDIWESSFELAPPLLPVLPVPVAPALTLEKAPLPVAPVYTELQQKAINTFQEMHTEAVKHREGQESRLNGDYGICDNIDRFASRNGSYETQMSEVKENLIRQTAMYSGNYTYPVPCPEGGDASRAFSNHGNKWRGAYGLNRLIQLEQLIELIKTKWDDSMVNRKTPAFRNGLKVGDVVRYTRHSTPSFWVFRRDDESMSPSFHKLTDKDDYTDIDLNYIVKVDKDEISKPRAVSEFLSELQDKADKKADIERQIASLQKQLTDVQTEIGMLDYGLADQHKVKRIA
ncbi:hypothetical protein QGX12_gp069 [Pseudomonas phage Kremar]|uniref:Uncharacterized protein n=1 Tax=Pseudomonas phage Kremar TaxID=2928831 RepID=A0AAE9KEH2_9CAUD|nr:hypothetical protein QGX12_gp069 [Pseudomonas phage Kremar]UOL48575.1 hypothetical protein [Pseudomonas phage Kremar]